MQTDSAIELVRESATSVLGRVYLGNTLRAWLLALAVFAVAFGGLLLARYLVTRRLTRLAAHTRTQIDDYVLTLLGHTRYTFVLIVALAAALKVLVLPARVAGLVMPLARLAVIIQVGLWLNELIALYLARLTAQKTATDVASVTTIRAIAMVARLTLWLIVFLAVLRNFGVDITAMVTALGIGGIAVALAVQNVLGDLLASLSIVLDKPFVVGDFIAVDTYLGTVEEIGLKTTRLKSLGGERIVISNADLLKARIRNYKQQQERRVVFTFGVEYGAPAAVLRQIPETVKQVITSLEQTRFDRSHFLKFGDSSLDFETVYYVLAPDYNLYMDIQQRINLELYDRIQALGASFAFPTRTVLIRSEVEGLVPAGREAANAER
ncbi:MAG TPA: mechanosensitive ion channel family protein [Gemmatimonadaceae bacterium]|nr:mechanosensitive ion channel family protein [Gemmatimonadaceae bacterium]